MKVKQYIRTTHNFDNETREWKYRPEVCDFLAYTPQIHPFWSLGVHALELDSWQFLRQIVDFTVDYFLKEDMAKFKEFMDHDSQYRQVVKEDILQELRYLIQKDMVRVREVEMSDEAALYYNS